MQAVATQAVATKEPLGPFRASVEVFLAVSSVLIEARQPVIRPADDWKNSLITPHIWPLRVDMMCLLDVADGVSTSRIRSIERPRHAKADFRKAAVLADGIPPFGVKPNSLIGPRASAYNPKSAFAI